jgi:hypothetical protein
LVELVEILRDRFVRQERIQVLGTHRDVRSERGTRYRLGFASAVGWLRKRAPQQSGLDRLPRKHQPGRRSFIGSAKAPAFRKVPEAPRAVAT